MYSTAKCALLAGLLLPLANPGFAKSDPDRQPVSILKKVAKETPKPNYGVAVPGKVKGRVTFQIEGNNVGLGGVSISDGHTVTQTDAEGYYSLKPNPQAIFVYLTKPSGYEVFGDWYAAIAPEIGFSLKESPEDSYTFIHVSDTHVSDSRVSREGLSRFVREVNSLSPMIRFVVNSGDLINLSKSLDNPPEVG